MATKKTTDTEVKTTKKAAAKKETVKKEAAPKKAAKKADAEKATTKKAAKTAEVVLQYAGNQYSYDDIQAKVKDAWKNQFKMKLKDFVNVQIYIKPEDGKAYFVVNGNANEEYFVEL